MKPFFSIIIPVFNAEETLNFTLSNINSQTEENFEVIIINDGSSDSSKQIIKEWEEKHPQIKLQYFEQENKGLGATRNLALEKCNGKIICLLDADDCWEPDKLEILKNYFSENKDVKCLYHAVKTTGLENSRRRNIYQVENVKDIVIKGNPIVPSAFCMERELFIKFPFSTDTRFHGAEDLHLWLRLLQDGIIPHCLDKCLGTYREEGGMSNRMAEHLNNVFNVLEDFYEDGLYDLEILARAKRRKFLEAARFYQKRKDYRTAENYYSAADFKSMKVAGLRFLNFLGISI